MVKLVEWTKKWSFLIMIVLSGVVYLTAYGHWQVYTVPLEQLKVRLLEAGRPLDNGGIFTVGDVSGGNPGGNVSGGNAGGDQTEISQNTVSDGNSDGGGEEIGSQGDDLVDVPVQSDPVYRSVEDTYFNDAVFIGDSRTVGMYEYAGLEETSTFYASTGLTVYKIFDSPIVEAEGQKNKNTVEQALSEHSFSKIYLMIGINEMGTGTVDSFMEAYEQAVAHLQELQPQAIIYLQAIMKVTTERSEQGDYITNEGIEERNERIAALADNRNIFYLDVNPLICDETGGMEPSYTFDGVHLKAKYISIWKDFLKTHAVDKVLLD